MVFIAEPARYKFFRFIEVKNFLKTINLNNNRDVAKPNKLIMNKQDIKNIYNDNQDNDSDEKDTDKNKDKDKENFSKMN